MIIKHLNIFIARLALTLLLAVMATTAWGTTAYVSTYTELKAQADKLIG